MDTRNTKAPWTAEVREMSRTPTIWIADANGVEVIGWPGFDGGDLTPQEHIQIARYIVKCANAHDELIALAREVASRRNVRVYADDLSEKAAEILRAIDGVEEKKNG